MSELGRLVTELQVHGVRVDPVKGNQGRRGGAGPSDHRALDLDGTTVRPEPAPWPQTIRSW